MNRKWPCAISAALILIAAVILFLQTNGGRRGNIAASHERKTQGQTSNGKGASQDQTTPRRSGSSSQLTSIGDGQKVDEKHKEDVRTGMKAIIEGLKQKGALVAVLPISDQLNAAIKDGDVGLMQRAFLDAIYAPSSRMSEAIPAIKAYLESPEPYVRYLAAEALLRVGDQSGLSVLTSIVKSLDAVPQGEQDLRMSAAHELARLGVISAEEAVFDLYKRTAGSGLLSDLAKLQSANVSEVFQKNGYYGNKHSIERYGIVGVDEFKSHISETFERSSDRATKNAAAWALARMTGDDQYVNHLIETARPALQAHFAKGEESFNESTEALRYLGSIQSPAAVQMLEQALDSQNPTAVRYAAVNLLFNQPGASDKAKQTVMRELQGQQQKLDLDLMMQIASKLDDPQIRAAAQAYDQRTGGNRWRYWGVERSGWPVQNWIYDYVVDLNVVEPL